MRRLVIATSLLSACGVACLSDRAVKPAGSPYPIYSVRAHWNDPPRPSAVVPTVDQAATDFDPSWYPQSGRISSRWTTIVIHHSATARGGAKTFDKHHRERNGWDELGYHFVIGNGTDTPDGYIEVGSRWHKQKHGAHCKTRSNYYNEHGIGVCLVGNLDRTAPTPRQLASLASLVRFLCDVCGIPPERLTTHGSVTRKTRCPGRFFSLAALRRAITRPATATRTP